MISFDFNGQVALVTGASRGIGKAICQMLLLSNCKVIGTYVNNEAAAQQCRQDFARFGNAFYLVKSDASEREQCGMLFGQAESVFGRSITLLVNNAGILKQGDFSQLSDEQWDNTFAVNLKGPFILCQELLKRTDKGAAIVNISSVGGQTGGNKAPDYAATKAALISLTRSVARLGADKNIRANAVAPGWIKTEIFNEQQLSALQQQAEAIIPLKRMGNPDEVATSVLFLLSDAASYITGHCINTNGGMYFG
ncbi:SDR family NAD(P)-dependent oxidoreductase [Shewanella algae]|uniref:SDR family NAD(P)-dependent oxidoreductase n=1 Tax=Shewanella algae TaxID=38313 RepID=UPI00132023D6|nr:SDR family NAD(P)-dependent oxidoreductase [Shewanella algae]MBO2657582.1 SDR family oxidoreductase [Shewanella algae]MBO2674452.1 SDR family oxidoreductase [Shewanella algae]QHD51956.1 SDR family oxidoreductase [Shewanella algae]